jgi:hypothetical protein
VASLHRPVLASKFAPVMLSSSGAVKSEVQPDINQATATKLMMNFIECSARPKWTNAQFLDVPSLSSPDCASISGFANRVTLVT